MSIRAVTLTQADIRELPVSQGCYRAGIQILIETAGIGDLEIHEVIIAGAFGSYIDVRSAITIGLLPSLPLICFKQVGNAAGLGPK